MEEKKLCGKIVEVCHKLSETKARVSTKAQAGVEAFKATKDFHDEKILYGAVDYLLGKNEVRSKVILHFPTSNLSFLDVELKEEDDEGIASESEATADLLATTNPLPIA